MQGLASKATHMCHSSSLYVLTSAWIVMHSCVPFMLVESSLKMVQTCKRQMSHGIQGEESWEFAAVALKSQNYSGFWYVSHNELQENPQHEESPGVGQSTTGYPPRMLSIYLKKVCPVCTH